MVATGAATSCLGIILLFRDESEHSVKIFLFQWRRRVYCVTEFLNPWHDESAYYSFASYFVIVWNHILRSDPRHYASHFIYGFGIGKQMLVADDAVA